MKHVTDQTLLKHNTGNSQSTTLKLFNYKHDKLQYIHNGRHPTQQGAALKSTEPNNEVHLMFIAPAR